MAGGGQTGDAPLDARRKHRRLPELAPIAAPAYR